MSADVKSRLLHIIRDVAEVDEVPEETPFNDLGINSMNAIEIISTVEKEFGVRVPDEALEEVDSFASLLRVVERLLH